MDNAIDFPNTYPLDRDLSGGQHYPTSEQPEPGFQHLGNFCFWNPETGRFLLQESGILGFEIHKSAHRIWNTTSDWNSDPSLTDKESRIQYLESRIHNMEFWIQDGLGLPDTGWSYDCSKISKSAINHSAYIAHPSLQESSLGCSGSRVGKGRRACNYVSGIWIPPPIPLWLQVNWAVRFLPISAKQKRVRM